MARDIEDFLRRAAERRQQKSSGDSQRPQQRAQSRPPQRAEPEKAETVEARVVERPSLRERSTAESSLRSGSVSDHVKQHLDTSGISDHAERLGDQIASANVKFDSRVSQRFDHDLSRIDDHPTVTGKASPSIFGASSSIRADELREALSDPKSIGQAILIAEILKRPDFE